MQLVTLLLWGFASLAVAWVLTPVAARVARRLGVVDRPSPRKVQATPVPVLGGAAVAVAVGAVGLAVAGLDARQWLRAEWLLPVLAAVAVFVVGLVDDWRGLSVAHKLAAQLGAAGLVVVGGSRYPLPTAGWLVVVATVFWVVVVTNAFNLLDNMNGLASGVAVIGSGAVAVMALLGGQVRLASLAAAVAGGSLGFLVHNFPSATVFLGDAGSLLLGFTVAVLLLELRTPAPATNAAVIPLLVLALPLFDTTLVVVSRLRRGLNPLRTPGMDHVSHRLAAAGLSRRDVVLALWLVAALGAGGAVVLAQALSAWAVAAAVALGVLFPVLVAWFELRAPRLQPATGEPRPGAAEV